MAVGPGAGVRSPMIPWDKTITIEGWIYVTATPTADTTTVFSIAGKYSGIDYDLRLLFETTSIIFHLQNSGGTAMGTTSTNGYGISTWPLNTWTHISCSMGLGLDLTIHINGAGPFSGGGLALGPGTGPNVNSGVYLGGPDGASAFQGMFDEVRVWNYARSTAEIQGAMYASVPRGAPGLVAYYTFDEGRASRVARDLASPLVTGDIALPTGARLVYPGRPGIGVWSVFSDVLLEGGSTSAFINLDGNAHVCVGNCPA